MYNQIIIDRLANLNNLCPLKKSNATIISKTNEFGDVVKFFAQINSNNVVAKITFKATGCSTFIAMCSFFCDMVKGKSIEESLKINQKDLENITKLDDSRIHVYKIILDTYALLIKKFNKEMSAGKVQPIDEIDPEPKVSKKKNSKSKSENIIVEINDITTNDQESLAIDENHEEHDAEPKNDVLVDEKKEENLIMEKTKEKKSTKKVNKEISTKTETENIETLDNKVEKKTTKKTAEDKELNKETKTVKAEKKVKEKTPKEKKTITPIDLTNIQKQIQLMEEKKQQEAEAKEKENSKQIQHINELRNKIANKETNEKMRSNSESLNDILFRINAKKSEIAQSKQEETTTIESKKDKKKIKDKSKEQKTEKNNEEKVQNTEINNEIKSEEAPKKEKKSLFSWFKKK